MNPFSLLLQNWYNKNKRPLPWRETNDPYKIWLSEIIMQQTRVDQGLEYYLRFVSHWPDIQQLANASEHEVLKQWQGLGYYSRARNLLVTAKQIVDLHDSTFPSDYKQLIQLKGIGPYTAAALASIAYNLPYAVVDGNVYRVLARYFGIEEAIDSITGKKLINELATTLLDITNPANHNQALMEFGALQCVPVSPDCSSCIFSDSCEAKRLEKVQYLPLKEKKIKTSIRYFNYFICSFTINDACFIAINKRSNSDIWTGLYDFPMIETKADENFETLQQHPNFLNWTNNTSFTLRKTSGQIKHILTHQKLFARFYHLHFETALDLNEINTVSLINKKSIGQFPLPRLIDRYLQHNDLNDC